MKKVNIRDVALEAGVSVTTVSKALNNYPDVSAETRKRIQEIADRLNYVADANARRMGSKENIPVVALLLGALEPADPSGFVYSILSGVYHACHQCGCDFTMMITPKEEQNTLPLLKLCREKGVSGVVATGLRLGDPYVEQLQKLSMPVAVIDMELMGPNLKNIAVNNVLAAEQAVGLLLDKGHRKIAMLNGKKEADVSHRRYRGYRRALEGQGIPVNEDYVSYCNFNRDMAQQATEELLSQHPEVTAIFAASDLMAFGACQAIEDRGLEVGKDIDVVGFDDIPLAMCLYGGVTTVAQDPYDMGMLAGETVCAQLRPGLEVPSRTPKFHIMVRNTAQLNETKPKR